MRVFNANDGAATVPGIAAGECSTLAVDGKVTLTGGSTVNVGADGYAAAGLSATGAPADTKSRLLENGGFRFRTFEF